MKSLSKDVTCFAAGKLKDNTRCRAKWALGSAMQSTGIQDKRSDPRHEQLTGVNVEDAFTGSRFPAITRNTGKGGLRIDLDQPVWPGSLFWIFAENGIADNPIPSRLVQVRWCRCLRTASQPMRYTAGVQFEPIIQHIRGGVRLRVIAGGAGRPR
jgi:hypothetical protein